MSELVALGEVVGAQHNWCKQLIILPGPIPCHFLPSPPPQSPHSAIRQTYLPHHGVGDPHTAVGLWRCHHESTDSLVKVGMSIDNPGGVRNLCKSCTCYIIPPSIPPSPQYVELKANQFVTLPPSYPLLEEGQCVWCIEEWPPGPTQGIFIWVRYKCSGGRGTGGQI